MLRACARVLKSGGRTAFLTIHPAPGLSEGQRRRASRDGPIAVATSRTHHELLESAGFREVTETDVTAEFATTTRGWMEEWGSHGADLVALMGQTVFDERQADRQGQLRAIEDGVLRRTLLTARRP